MYLRGAGDRQDTDNMKWRMQNAAPQTAEQTAAIDERLESAHISSARVGTTVYVCVCCFPFVRRRRR